MEVKNGEKGDSIKKEKKARVKVKLSELLPRLNKRPMLKL